MLVVKKLSISYLETGQKVFENLSFSVKKGEVVAIMGPSGCGKSTLLNYIQGLDNNKVIVTGEVNNPFKKVRTVFQENRLLPWRTVFNNAILGLEAEGVSIEGVGQENIAKTLASAGLANYKDHYPNQLSVGMKQRVNFVRAILSSPDLLLMDEPFSGLDKITKEKIQTDFLKLVKLKKLTTIFVTHSLEEAKFMADRIIVVSAEPTKIIHEYAKKDFDRISSIEYYKDQTDAE